MTQSADVYTATATTLEQFLLTAKSRFADGISLSDFGQTTVDGLRLAVSAVDALPMPGAERKLVVLTWAGDLFDAIAPLLIPRIAWPAWIVFRPAIRSVFLSFAGGAVEAILPYIRSQQ